HPYESPCGTDHVASHTQVSLVIAQEPALYMCIRPLRSDMTVDTCTPADGHNTMTRYTWSSGLPTPSRLHPRRDPDGPAHEGELMLPISLALPAASTAR